MRDCEWPIQLPLRSITQEELERIWNTDTYNHIDCAQRFRILRDYITQRDALLTGK